MRLKYTSVQIAIARIKTKFKIFPTPRYIRIKKRVREMEAIKPRRECAKRIVVKKVIKNKGITPKMSGSTK